MRTITVIGAGYVGLVTGICLAQYYKVIIVECDNQKLDVLNNNSIPLYEVGLNELFQKKQMLANLSFTNNLKSALINKPEAIFICVGTPSNHDGSADLSAVYSVASEIGKDLLAYCTIITKSTVPVGTTFKVKFIIQKELTKRKSQLTFDVASNPEFLKQGSAVHDFTNPDRIVVGTERKQVADTLRSLYKPFFKEDNQFCSMNVLSAELSKYAANAMLATRISFVNQLARLADKVGADIHEMTHSMGMDPRIGKDFLRAGIGYGGSCFPKDVKALVHMGEHYKSPMTLAKEVDTINTTQLSWFSDKIFAHYQNKIHHKTIGIWGLSFKPETDDTRSSAALNLIYKLSEHGAHIIVYDPIAKHNLNKKNDSNIDLVYDKNEILSQADFLIIMTEWKEFLKTPLSLFTRLKDKCIFDGRNCFDPYDMDKQGITYICIGRPTTSDQKEVDSLKEEKEYFSD